ncbi:unnamed protein product [Adineta steineri]|uniref:Major facilitator superfamily (MFS) profile domain-containing protein n=1 Tax=Adineta steineri TaxID=433720 RepID=A0A813Q891_9BILA|nr:unnamed protein product [Adineta steineri]CAF1413813.1 unnamed protein product [Adineta steineri]CAF3645146.1 unnamed protein product [Adineta steineri]CAF3755571.1 unnamed protein product [Adineta steineri]
MDTSATYTLEECVNYIGLGKFQWRLFSIISFCTMADAGEILLLTILGPALQCYWPYITDIRIAALTTCVFSGTLCGGFILGLIADKYGRRRVIVTSAIIISLSGILTALAPSYNYVLLTAFFVGVGMGGLNQGNNLLLEYLPSSSRAMLVISIQLFWSFGGIYEYVLGMIIMPSYGWRLLIALTSLPLFVILIGMYYITESPRFYVASGQQEKAEDLLKEMASVNQSPLPPGKLVDTNAKDECGSITELFHRNCRKTTFLLAYIWIVAGLDYYGLILLNTSLMTSPNNNNNKLSSIESNITQPTQCKMLTTDDYTSLIFTTSGEMLGIPLLFILLRYAGRRTISVINYSISAICFALFFFVIPHRELWRLNIITFIGRMVIMCQFSLLPLYTMEVYPTSIRGLAIGCAFGISRIGAMTSPFLSQVLLKKTYFGTIGIYVFLTAIAAFCSFLLPTETKGHALKQSIFDPDVPLIISENGVTPTWTKAVDNTTSLANMDNGNMNKNYKSLEADNMMSSKTQ